MKKILCILIALVLCFMGYFSSVAQEPTDNEETHIRIVKKNKNGEVETINHDGNLSQEEIQEILAEHGIEDLDIMIHDEMNFDTEVPYHLTNGIFPNGKAKKILGFGVVFDQGYSNNLIAKSVMDNSPADEGGLNKGDVFVSIDGKATGSLEDIKEIIADKKAGDKVELEVLRYGKIEKKSIRLDSIDVYPNRNENFFYLNPNDEDYNVKWWNHSPKGKPKLGVIIEDDDKGVVVNKVFPGSLADELGIIIDDVITEINDQSVELTEELREVLRELKEGDPINLKIKRKNKKINIKGNL